MRGFGGILRIVRLLDGRIVLSVARDLLLNGIMLVFGCWVALQDFGFVSRASSDI